MYQEHSHDLRGRIALLGRLLRFDKEAFIHLLFYRCLIVSSIVTFIIFALSFPFHVLFYGVKVMIALDWVFFTTQVFESAKAMSLADSRGAAFGHLNPSFVSSMLVSRNASAYRLLPFLLLAVWIAGLAAYIAVVLI